MKITNVSNFMGYKNNSSNIKKTDKVDSKKYDTIQISKNNIINTQSNNTFDIEKTKSKIVNELNNDANADKIEQLKAQINNNAYVVTPEELAKILLSI